MAVKGPAVGGVERFFERYRNDGLGPAVAAAFRRLVPRRAKAIPEVDFALRCVLDYADDPVSVGTALNGFGRGFLPSCAAAYDFDTHRVDAYVTDFVRFRDGWEINGSSNEILDDKGTFCALLHERGLGHHLPEEFGRFRGGRFVGDDRSLRDLVRDEGTVVVKGREGGEGNHVHFCRFENGRLTIDGGAIPLNRLGEAFEGQEYLVTEYCRPGEYIRSVFPDAASSVRAFTINPAGGDPFITHLTHKIGTDETAPRDTFGDGGISVHMDDESGRLGEGVRLREGRLVPCRRHPDTGVEIPGTVVPEWPRFRDDLLTIADAIPEVQYVGWDLLIPDGGPPKVLEGNANPGIEVQYHRPLLDDPRTRRFFRNQGIDPNATPFDRVASIPNGLRVTGPSRMT